MMITGILCQLYFWEGEVIVHKVEMSWDDWPGFDPTVPINLSFSCGYFTHICAFRYIQVPRSHAFYLGKI